MEFTLKITMGNDAMQTTQDIAGALHKAAGALEAGAPQGGIWDDNGNRVGEYSLPETPDPVEDGERFWDLPHPIKPYGYGEHFTVGIVDEADGGSIIAYVHKDNAERVRAALAGTPSFKPEGQRDFFRDVHRRVSSPSGTTINFPEFPGVGVINLTAKQTRRFLEMLSADA